MDVNAIVKNTCIICQTQLRSCRNMQANQKNKNVKNYRYLSGRISGNGKKSTPPENGALSLIFWIFMQLHFSPSTLLSHWQLSYSPQVRRNNLSHVWFREPPRPLFPSEGTSSLAPHPGRVLGSVCWALPEDGGRAWPALFLGLFRQL